MSADDIVPDAYDGQSYNRYSYVDNGPLSAIDPTGHASCTPHPCQPVETITVTGYSGCACGGGGGGADGQPGRDAPTVNEVVLVTAPRYKSEPLFIATLSPLNLIGLIISPAEAAEKVSNKNTDPNKTCNKTANAAMDSTTKQIANPEIGAAYDLARGAQTIANGSPSPMSC